VNTTIATVGDPYSVEIAITAIHLMSDPHGVIHHPHPAVVTGAVLLAAAEVE
jgi:hypothetical protein